jgi:hypothetical protein
MRKLVETGFTAVHHHRKAVEEPEEAVRNDREA